MGRLFVISLMLLGSSGCGGGVNTDYSDLGLVDVGGIVTLDDAPVANATVMFEAADGSSSIGMTDDSGEFELQFNSERSGVLPGPKIVRISTASAMSDEEFSESEEGGDPDAEAADRPEEQVPTCYNVESKLTVDVTAETDWLVFSLTGDCSTTSAD